MTEKIVAIIPAHNEEDGIEETLESLNSQTYPVDMLVVIDNSTDKTEEIAKAFAKHNGKVTVIATKNNRKKKSGAINQGVEYLKNQGIFDNYDFLMVMDADTQLKQNLAEEAMQEFSLHSQLGGICSRAEVKNVKTRGLTQGLLYHLQNVEFCEFNRSRTSPHKDIKVLHGMCTVYKTSVLRQVMQERKVHKLFDEDNITEDYELTVCIKELGFKVSAGMKMYAWTDVPLSISSLWKQRVRWLRGGLDTLWSHGWNRATWKDIVGLGSFMPMFLGQVALVILALPSIVSGDFMPDNKFWILMTLMYVDSTYTLRYIQNPKLGSVLVRLLFIPQILYAWFTIAQQFWAIVLFALKIEQEW